MAQTLEDLHARLRPATRPGETPATLLESAVAKILEERSQEAARWETARAEAQAVLNGPFRPHAESMALAYQRLGLTPSPDRSLEELEREAEAILDSLPPEKIAEMERLGLL